MMEMAHSRLVLSMLVLACGFCLGNVFKPWSAVHAQANTRVFEIRTYTAAEGKLDALHARFRDHTLALFEKHNMTSVGYFKPQDEPLKQNTLIYILAHPSREAAAKNWQACPSGIPGKPSHSGKALPRPRPERTPSICASYSVAGLLIGRALMPRLGK